MGKGKMQEILKQVQDDINKMSLRGGHSPTWQSILGFGIKKEKMDCFVRPMSGLAMTMLLLMGFEAKAQCVSTQDCAALGYTKSTSCVGGIKCPFGNAWYCPTKCPPPVCAIGLIYNSDNTCSYERDSSKMALGVVVYVTEGGEHGQVMAARDVGSIYWSTEYVDISSLPNYTSESTAATDFNSCTNTDKIMAQGGSSTYPAAWAARNYTPTAETKGKWCLPAAGIMTSIYNNQNAVQAGIAKLGGVAFPSCCTWSSSEYNSAGSWRSNLNNSYGLSNYYVYGYKNATGDVRPVLEF